MTPTGYMSPLEINRLCERLIAYRDGLTNRSDRDLIADACNALDIFTKQTREMDARDRFACGEHFPEPQP